MPALQSSDEHHVTREQFAAAVDALRAKAASASDDEMLVGLMQLTAMVGDGHTRVNPKPGLLHTFPTGVVEIEGVPRIVRGAGPAAELVGGRLTKIDDMPLVDAIARIRTLIPVITGANTFSAALENAIDFRQVARAMLVGETIGERPNSYSENDEFILPRSKLLISYSTRYYEFLPGTDALVTPDREILPAWVDWVAGRDPVLEWIVSDPRPPG